MSSRPSRWSGAAVSFIVFPFLRHSVSKTKASQNYHPLKSCNVDRRIMCTVTLLRDIFRLHRSLKFLIILLNL